MTPMKKGGEVPKAREIHVDQSRAIVARTKDLGLPDDEHAMLSSALDTLGFLTTALEGKDVSLARLRRYLFGSATESSKNVLGDADGGNGSNSGTRDPEPEEKEKDKEKKPKGHDRNPVSEYEGAERCPITHATLEAKQACPACNRGKLYPLDTPKSLVRVTGMAPLTAKVYELERLRCNACGIIFTATAPEHVGQEKYDEGAAAMIALLKYGAGMLFNRIQNLQRGLGIPLPATTQWEIVAERSEPLLPAYQELVRHVLHKEESAPVMTALHDWMERQIDQKQVEPNSSLGKAYAYMLRHWEGLTLFLRESGAPLDNNTCERALKKAVLNRKNAYFYRSKRGAEVGDLYMSLTRAGYRGHRRRVQGGGRPAGDRGGSRGAPWPRIFGRLRTFAERTRFILAHIRDASSPRSLIGRI